MRLDGPGSSNFEDRTGQGGGSILGGGGGMLGLLVPLILSRFGIVGLLILALGYCALGGLGGGGILGGGGSSPGIPQGLACALIPRLRPSMGARRSGNDT